MLRSTRGVVIVIVLLALAAAPLEAVGKRKAEYVGGTVAGLSERVEGTLSTQDQEAVVFTADRSGQRVRVPYSAVTSLEYGQHAGRRVGVAILVSPLALFSKKRKHYLTLGYTDERGEKQAAVFELGKDIVRTTLTVLETRTGQSIEFQDDESRKAGRGR